jgi:hypothetical protein
MAGIPDLSIPVLPQAPPGAVRVFSRAGGAELLVTAALHTMRPGEALAHVWWVQSPEIAADVVAEARRLLVAAHVPPGPDGWAGFPAIHAAKLVRAAADTRFAVLSSRATARRIHWTTKKAARLGYLVGRGWDAKRIARDPTIASTPNNVHRQANRVGLSLGEARDGGIGVLTEAVGRLPELSTAG